MHKPQHTFKEKVSAGGGVNSSIATHIHTLYIGLTAYISPILNIAPIRTTDIVRSTTPRTPCHGPVWFSLKGRTLNIHKFFTYAFSSLDVRTY